LRHSPDGTRHALFRRMTRYTRLFILAHLALVVLASASA
jgi:hypothetical protein